MGKVLMQAGSSGGITVVDIGEISSTTNEEITIDIDISTIVSAYSHLTTENFFLVLKKYTTNRYDTWLSVTKGEKTFSPTLSYNPSTGIVSVTGQFYDTRNDCKFYAYCELYCVY